MDLSPALKRHLSTYELIHALFVPHRAQAPRDVALGIRSDPDVDPGDCPLNDNGALQEGQKDHLCGGPGPVGQYSFARSVDQEDDLGEAARD